MAVVQLAAMVGVLAVLFFGRGEMHVGTVGGFPAKIP